MEKKSVVMIIVLVSLIMSGFVNIVKAYPPPDPPSSFITITRSRFTIELYWVKGAGADYTYVKGKVGSYPINRTDGLGGFYNNTGNSSSWTVPVPNDHLYFRAWSWNNSGGGWSIINASADNTTFVDLPPTFLAPTPANNSINQSLSLWWIASILDPEGDYFDYNVSCSNGQYYAGHENNGSKPLHLSGLHYSTLYTVHVNVTDNYLWTNATYYFTTKADTVPDKPVLNSPSNNSVGVSLTTTLNVTAYDSDGDDTTCGFYWANDTLIWNILYRSNGYRETPPLSLQYNTTYSWYAISSDGILQNISDVFTFTTESLLMYPPWDINQDGNVNYLDISALVSNYGLSGAPGWIPEDINNDGTVNYLDVSSLVSHYGESY